MNYNKSYDMYTDQRQVNNLCNNSNQMASFPQLQPVHPCKSFPPCPPTPPVPCCIVGPTGPTSPQDLQGIPGELGPTGPQGLQLTAGDVISLNYVADGLTLALNIGGDDGGGILWSVHQMQTRSKHKLTALILRGV